MPEATPPMGHLDGGIHHFPVRVYYEDTDAGGIVYHANYLRFAERARTELMRLLGVAHSEMGREDGLIFAVRRSVVEFHRPARLDDALDVASRVLQSGGASLTVEQSIRRSDEADALAVVTSKLACIDRDMKPARLPARLRVAIATYLAPSADRPPNSPPTE